MRLSDHERKCIKDVILKLDPAAKIYLFGSRVHDEKKGGDIDLLVLSSEITEKNRRNIKIKLYDTLGEQKIDLIIAKDASKPFIRIALESGVLI